MSGNVTIHRISKKYRLILVALGMLLTFLAVLIVWGVYSSFYGWLVLAFVLFSPCFSILRCYLRSVFRIEFHEDGTVRCRTFFGMRHYAVQNVASFELSAERSYFIKLYERCHFFDGRGEELFDVTSTLDGYAQIVQWASSSFISKEEFDSHQVAKEYEQMQQEARAQAVRLPDLHLAQRFARYSWVVVALLAVGAVVQQSVHSRILEQVLVWMAIFIPVALLSSLPFFKGTLRFYSERNAPFPSIQWPLGIVSFGLAVLGSLHYRIIGLHDSISGLLLVLPIGAWAVVALRRNSRLTKPLLWFAFLLCYLGGSFICLNSILSGEDLRSMECRVLKKKEKTGKRGGHPKSLSVRPLLDNVDPFDIPIEEEEYDNVNEGDSVLVFVRDGFFGLPIFDHVTLPTP